MPTSKPTTQPRKAANKGMRAVGAVTSERLAAFTAPGLTEKQGQQLVTILQARLDTLVDLALTLKHIHWNVVGPAFIGVHHMLDPQYQGVQQMVDEVAERIATLGGVPSGLPGHIVEHRTWNDYDLGRADSQAHLAALDLVYRAVIEEHRDAIDATEKSDRVTQDILIGQTATLEQYHWFVRSHLEDFAGGLANAGATTELDAARAATAKDRPVRTSRGMQARTPRRTGRATPRGALSGNGRAR